jgi:hypothetical protein
VLDNLNIHKNEAAKQWLMSHPRVHFHYPKFVTMPGFWTIFDHFCGASLSASIVPSPKCDVVQTYHLETEGMS